ncbi:ABC transporter permease subunit [Pseudomonas sp. HR96]|uniref:ABC transporter permease subunit n=1 Tax=Pseudomonas sp. HR96 TaxID=1027966 RepID=UPI002A757EA6|nr:ABC transporter permease subunit [Pseudomonas sp. HR96]WPP00093.1 ABC transporter permease subunit [Pseudomonas sp. HR96]
MTELTLDTAAPAAAKGRRWRLTPLCLVLPGVLFLAVFLLYPSLQLLAVSLKDPRSGAWTLAAFHKVFSGGVYTRTLFSTFNAALQTTLLCLLLGYPLAYWLARLSPRRQRLTALFVLLPFWTSALVKNFAWLVFLGRNGVVNDLLVAAGFAPAELLFQHATVIFAMVHTMLPLAVVVMLPIMNQIDQRLGQAADTLGASAPQRFWRIYLPLSMPGAAAAGLLTFIASLGFFIVPTLLGGTRDTQLSQLIIVQINQLQNWQMGAAIAVMLVAAALASCFVYDRTFGLSTLSRDTAGRRAGSGLVRGLGMGIGRIMGDLCDALARPLGTRRAGWLLSSYAWLTLAVLVVPILAFIPMAFTASTFLSFPPTRFSLHWFAQYLQSPVWMGATLRSFGIGIASAMITLPMATLAAFGLARSRTRLGGVAFLIFMLPMIIPPIVISVSLFYLFAHLSLVATNLGIIIGHTVIALPMAFVVVLATFKHYDWRLDQAAATLGAAPWRVFCKVTLPLIKGGLCAGAVTAFLQSFEELTVAMFIGGGLKTTLPKQMWDDILLQVSPTLAAASVVVLLIVCALFGLMEWLRPAERD